MCQQIYPKTQFLSLDGMSLSRAMWTCSHASSSLPYPKDSLFLYSVLHVFFCFFFKCNGNLADHPKSGHKKCPYSYICSVPLCGYTKKHLIRCLQVDICFLLNLLQKRNNLPEVELLSQKGKYVYNCDKHG